MKTSTNKKELKSLNACKSGCETFVNAHGDKDTLLSECLDSNGWDDVWWLISRCYEQFSEKQKNDLHLLGCDWAESCLHIFESEFPDDKRPRLAIKAKRDFIQGKITSAALAAAARSAAWSADWAAESAESARPAAWSAAWSAAAAAAAAWSAAWSAESAARSVAEPAAAARPAVMVKYTADLKELFIKWETQQ